MQSRIDAENCRECSDEPCQGGVRSNSDDGDDHEEPESTPRGARAVGCSALLGLFFMTTSSLAMFISGRHASCATLRNLAPVGGS